MGKLKRVLLPRAITVVDEKGRMTIPHSLREALKMEGKTAVEVELYPDLKNPTALVIKKLVEASATPRLKSGACDGGGNVEEEKK